MIGLKQIFTWWNKNTFGTYLKTYKKNTIIDKQGTVSKAVYYLSEGILAMEYKKNSIVFIRDFIFEN